MVLFDQARLLDGDTLSDPVAFSERLGSVLVQKRFNFSQRHSGKTAFFPGLKRAVFVQRPYSRHSGFRRNDDSYVVVLSVP